LRHKRDATAAPDAAICPASPPRDAPMMRSESSILPQGCVIGWGVITHRTYRQIIGWGVIEPVMITPLRGAWIPACVQTRETLHGATGFRRDLPRIPAPLCAHEAQRVEHPAGRLVSPARQSRDGDSVGGEDGREEMY